MHRHVPLAGEPAEKREEAMRRFGPRTVTTKAD